MKTNNNHRTMVYTLSINDFDDDKSILDSVQKILEIHKLNIFDNSEKNYKVEMDNMVLVIEGCDC